VTLQRRADGSGSETVLALGDHSHHHIEDISGDGRFLAWSEVGAGVELNTAWTVDLNADAAPESFPPDTVGVTADAFSPDNRWLLYTAFESDERHVYVGSYPDGDRRILVSVGEGAEAMWSQDGQEIYYRSGRQMMVVPVQNTDTMELGRPSVLFEGNYFLQPIPAGGRNYDLADDGRFLMVKPIDADGSFALRMNVVLNWYDELNRLAPIE